ncbi:MFS transporter, partial [Staphylococcus aureus]|uniref:MFS transporter n=1 Tax=Staphylococcus aureus TaxID=1280 RepID=UPI001782301C
MTNSNIRLYILGFLAFFASLIQNIYTPIIPRLYDDFQVPLFWINATVGGFIFIVAVMQIVLGRSIDSRDSKKVLLTGLGIVIISSFICAMTHNFILFAISRLFQAIGCGIIPLVTLTLLAKLSTDNGRAQAMANYQIFLSCAPALAPILGSTLGARWDYIGIFSFLLVISIVLFLIIFFIDIPNVEKGIVKLTEKIEEKYLIDKVFITLVTLGFLIFLTYFSILVYLPTLLNNTYDIGVGISGVLFLPITVSVILGTCVGIVPALLSTIISKRFEHIKGKVLGVFNFVRYIGMTVGALLIGIISHSLVPFYFTTVTIMLIIIFLYIK